MSSKKKARRLVEVAGPTRAYLRRLRAKHAAVLGWSSPNPPIYAGVSRRRACPGRHASGLCVTIADWRNNSWQRGRDSFRPQPENDSWARAAGSFKSSSAASRRCSRTFSTTRYPRGATRRLHQRSLHRRIRDTLAFDVRERRQLVHPRIRLRKDLDDWNPVH
jgi:hypothetical protein